LNKNIINTFLTSTVKIGINLFLFFVLSKKLLPYNYGQVSTYDSVLQYLFVIGTIGIPTFSVQHLSKNIYNKEVRKNIIKSFFTLLMFSSILIILFLTLTILLFKVDLKLMLVVILCINIFVNNLQCDWYFEGTQRFDIIRNRVVFFKILFLALIFFTINNENSLIIYSSLFTLSQLILFFITIKIILINEGMKLQELISISHLSLFLKINLKNLFSTYIIQILISVYLFCDIFILKYNTSMLEVGYYSMALDYNKQIDLIIIFNVIVSFILLTIILCFSKELVILFSNINYNKSSEILGFLSMIILFIPISNILGNVNSIISSDFQFLLKTFLFISLISIITNYFFSKHYNSFGTGVSTIISEFLVFTSLLYRNRKRLTLSKKYIYLIFLFSLTDILFVFGVSKNTYVLFIIFFFQYLILLLYSIKNKIVNQLKLLFSK
jgi:O-antigen/teichoic acid export membrane protein